LTYLGDTYGSMQLVQFTNLRQGTHYCCKGPSGPTAPTIAPGGAVQSPGPGGPGGPTVQSPGVGGPGGPGGPTVQSPGVGGPGGPGGPTVQSPGVGGPGGPQGPQPTLSPTTHPTVIPGEPTKAPTFPLPTKTPTATPTIMPTKVPTLSPTTMAPTTPVPSSQPTACRGAKCTSYSCQYKFQILPDRDCTNSFNEQTSQYFICILDNPLQYPLQAQITDQGFTTLFHTQIVNGPYEFIEVGNANLCTPSMGIALSDPSGNSFYKVFTINTSCETQPIYIGDVYSAFKVVSFTNPNQGNVTGCISTPN